MKNINLLLFFAGMICNVYSQNNNYNLPPEFKEIAIQAFQKANPETKQWFADVARQHPAGPFDTPWAKQKLKEKFGIAKVNNCGELLMVMMEYQRMLNKEEREDKKIESKEKQMTLDEKENKLKLDNAKIDQQKKEADEKANNSMNAALNSLWLGIVSGTPTIVSGNTGMNNQNRPPVRLSPGAIQKIDSSKLKKPNLNEQVQKAEKQKKDDEAASKASEDHKKAMSDAVKKLQNQLTELGKNIKF